MSRHLGKERRQHHTPLPPLYANHCSIFLGPEAQRTAKDMLFCSTFCLTKFCPSPYKGAQFPSGMHFELTQDGRVAGSLQIRSFIMKKDPTQMSAKQKQVPCRIFRGPQFLLWEVGSMDSSGFVLILCLDFAYSHLYPSLHSISFHFSLNHIK